MPDAPFDRSRAAHKPLPQCKAFLICDEFGFDEITGKFDLYGLVNSLEFPRFPAEAPPLVVYLQLYDGIGRYDLSMELRNLADGNSVAAGIFAHLEFPIGLLKLNWCCPSIR